MAIARCPLRIRFKTLTGAIGFAGFFAISGVLAAQKDVKPMGDAVAASLPDAPTTTGGAPAVNELRLRAVDFQGAEAEQQAGQNQQTTPPQNPPTTPPQNPPQPPSSSAPSLGDLGLSPEQTKPDLDAQARLDRRTHMLKVHQELGLYTLIPMAGACISSAWATPQRNTYGDTTARDVHVAIAGVAIGMYGATAYYAIRAPRVPDGPTRGGIKIHKYLIWIHAPGMILTPILGTMAFNDISNGQKVTGIAQYHSAVAWTTIAAYGASIIAVTWPIHLKL